MPHMPVRLEECAIVMSGRVSASPGRMEVLYETMSRPAGSKINADEASAMSVMACLTKPPFALAARVLPRVTAIVQRLASRLLLAAAGESGSPRCGTSDEVGARGVVRA